MSAEAPQAPRPRRWRRILLAQVVVALSGLVALELLARGYLWLRHEPYRSGETLAEVRQLLDANRSFVPGPAGAEPPAKVQDLHEQVVLHPYLGFEMDNRGSFVEDEYQRLRSGESADEFQIFLVGGSVAALFGQHELGRNTLRDSLAADPRFAGRKLRVLNFGRGAFKEPQQINFVVYLLALGFKPGAVINIDGFNEVALGHNNISFGLHPAFPAAAQWANLSMGGTSSRAAIDILCEIRAAQVALEDWGERFESWHFEWSCLLGKTALQRMHRLRRSALERSAAYAQLLAAEERDARKRGPALSGGSAAAVSASVECWKESSRSLADICRARGIVYLQVLQPTQLDQGSKPQTATELKRSDCDPTWVTGVQLGYPLLRAAGEELRAAGVEFVDATRLFAEHSEDIYYDCCHFGHRGNDILARKIAEELLTRWPRGR